MNKPSTTVSRTSKCLNITWDNEHLAPRCRNLLLSKPKHKNRVSSHELRYPRRLVALLILVPLDRLHQLLYRQQRMCCQGACQKSQGCLVHGTVRQTRIRKLSHLRRKLRVFSQVPVPCRDLQNNSIKSNRRQQRLYRFCRSKLRRR